MIDNSDTLENQTPISTSDSDTIKQLFAAGNSVNEICKRLHITKTMATRRLKPDLCKKITSLLSQKYTIGQISTAIGINSSRIGKWINYGEDQALHAYPSLKYPIGQEALIKLVVSDHLKLIPRYTIQKLYNIHDTTVKRILDNAGFNLLSNDRMKKIYNHSDGQYNKPISDDLYHCLTGMLLGDGHMQVQTRSHKVPDYNYDLHDYQNALAFLSELKTTSLTEDNTKLSEIIDQFNTVTKIIADMPTSRFTVLKSIIESHWVEHINTFFEDSGYMTRVYGRTNIRKYGRTSIRKKSFIEKTTKVFSIALDSCASVQLELIRKKWYDNSGKKHIPFDLKITPDVLLYWYIDDGSLSISGTVILFTNDFSKSEVLLLARKIYNATGSTFYIRERITEGKVYPILVCSKRHDVDIFFDYLEESKKENLLLAKKEFSWKFDTRIRKFEYLHSIKDSNVIVEKYLSTKDGKKKEK